MKRLAIILFLLPCFIVSFALQVNTVEAELLAGFEMVAENEYLKLYIDPDTTQFVVENKEHKTRWFSNPDNRNQDQFAIEYFTPDDDRRYMNNFKDAVENEQYEMTEIENGIRIDYIVGRKWMNRHYLPVMIEKERFHELVLDGLEESDRDLLLNHYTLLSLEEMPDGYERSHPGALNVDKDVIFGEYTLVSHREEPESQAELVIYLLDVIRENRMDLIYREDIRLADLNSFTEGPVYVLRRNIIPWDLEDMLAIIQGKSEYLPEDGQYDHMRNNIDPYEPYVERFGIPVEYILEGESLVVKISTTEIEYPVDVIPSHEQYSISGVSSMASGAQIEEVLSLWGRAEGRQEVTIPLHSIDLLPHFDQLDPTKEGYIFVPEGSGSLIEIPKSRAVTYSMNVYGRDPAFFEEERRRYFESIYIPVFGMKRGDKAFVGIIEKGESMAQIMAATARTRDGFERVYPRFVTIPHTILEIPGLGISQAGGNLYVYQDGIFLDDIQVRYSFLHNEKANYTGMASVYRNYVVDRYALEKNNPSDEIPFYLELVGGFPTVQPVMGIPVETVAPLTTYKQVSQIAGELYEEGIRNIHIRYSGWNAGGFKHDYLNGVKLESKLGSTADFQDLIDYVNTTNGIHLYPDISLLNVYNSRFFDGFSPRRDVSRTLDQQHARLYDYEAMSYQIDPESARFIISPRRLEGIIDEFLVSYRDYQLPGLSLRYIGRQLHSDHRAGKSIDRTEAIQYFLNSLSLLSEENSLIVEGGNAFTWPYVDHIINMPLEDSARQALDRRVPFMQMVLHGYINFAGYPINFSPTKSRQEVLRAIEGGAYPHFKLMYSGNDVVKETEFNHLYSAHYKSWWEEILEYYRLSNQVLKGVQGQEIIGHQELMEGVFQTTFENGKAIVVNYNTEPVTVNGIRIQGEDAKLINSGGDG